MNKVQTFDDFNKRQKRPDRKGHLRLCGYEYAGVLDPWDGKPRALALRRLQARTEATGLDYHGVYIRDLKGMNGDHGYSLYIKAV